MTDLIKPLDRLFLYWKTAKLNCSVVFYWPDLKMIQEESNRDQLPPISVNMHGVTKTYKLGFSLIKLPLMYCLHRLSRSKSGSFISSTFEVRSLLWCSVAKVFSKVVLGDGHFFRYPAEETFFVFISLVLILFVLFVFFFFFCSLLLLDDGLAS